MSNEFTMSDSRQLGIYWDTQGLFCVETLNDQPVSAFLVPLQTTVQSAGGPKNYSPSGMPIVAALEDSFREQKITHGSIHLSLPARDIISRSFVVPWMLPDEIPKRIPFEAGKYIPFPIDELAYAFHPIFFEEEGTKLIRIVMAAIKKQTLNFYIHSIEQAKLQIQTIEPGPLSLLRILHYKKTAALNQTLAIVECGPTSGKIIVVDEGAPQFVREFYLAKHLNPNSRHPPQVNSLNPNALIKEITISMEYVRRQNRQLVQQIILIAASVNSEFKARLEYELELPVTVVDLKNIFKHSPSVVNETPYLYAYGAALIPSVANPVEFFLFQKKKQINQSASTPSQVNTKSLNTLSIITIAAVGLLIVVLIILLITQVLKP